MVGYALMRRVVVGGTIDLYIMSESVEVQYDPTGMYLE